MARLLLVDPDLPRREALARSLRQHGHAVLDLAGPVEALDAIERAGVDLVLATVDELGGPGRALSRAVEARSRSLIVWLGEEKVIARERTKGAPVAGFLPLPVAPVALDGLLGRLVGVSRPSWSGRDFLAAVDGTSSRFPIPRVLFLAHRLSAEGRLEVESASGLATVDLRDGRVVGVSGVPGLAPEVAGAAVLGLEEAIGRSIAAGRLPDKAMEQAALAVGVWAVQKRGRGSTLVRFRADHHVGSGGFPLPLSIPQLLSRGLQLTRGADMVRQSFERFRTAQVHVEVPVDAPESRWGLPPAALRMVRDASGVKTLEELVDAGKAGERPETWLAADLLLTLGFLQLVDPEGGEELEPEELTTRGPGDLEAEPSGLADADELEDDLSEELIPGDLLGDSAESGPTPVEPPSEDPATARLVEMQVTLSSLRGAEPLEVLGIRTSDQATPDGIESAFRKVSALYHPDRYGQEPEAVGRLAADCFAVVGRAREELLEDPAHLELVRLRLQAKEQGKVFLTAGEREVLRHRGREAERALKRRAWAEAIALSDEVLAQDPESFEARFVNTRARVGSGALGLVEGADQLRALTAPDPRSRAVVLNEAGELLLKAGKEAAAYKCFRQAVEADPEHIEARRQLRLRDMRESRSPSGPGPSKSADSKAADSKDKDAPTDLGARIASFFKRGR